MFIYPSLRGMHSYNNCALEVAFGSRSIFFAVCVEIMAKSTMLLLLLTVFVSIVACIVTTGIMAKTVFSIPI